MLAASSHALIEMQNRKGGDQFRRKPPKGTFKPLEEPALPASTEILAPVSWGPRGLPWSQSFLLRREETTQLTTTTCSSTAITFKATSLPLQVFFEYPAWSLCPEVNASSVTWPYVLDCPGQSGYAYWASIPYGSCLLSCSEVSLLDNK